MTVFKKALIAVPVALLVLAGEASAQRIRVGVGAGYGGYGYSGYGYGGYRGYGYGYPGYYGYGYPSSGLTVGFGNSRYGVVVGSPGYGYPAYGYPASSYPAYSTWSGGYYQPVVGSYATPATYTVSPTYQANGGVQTGGVVQAGGVVGRESGIVQASSVSTAPAPAEIEVTVPAGAEVWFDGEKSTDTGEQRKFVSKELQPGMAHAFTMKVHWTNNGQDATREFTVPMQPGEDSKMDARPLLTD